MRLADCVSYLQFAFRREPRRHYVFRYVSRVIRGAPVYLRGIFTAETAAAVSARAAVGIHYYLPSCEPRVAGGSAYDESSRGIYVILCVLVHEGSGYDLVDDFALYVRAQFLDINVGTVLCGNDYRFHARDLVVVVLDGDLRFAVGTEIIEYPLFPYVRKLLAKLMRKIERHRKITLRFVGGVSEHHSLIARAYLVVFGAAYAVFDTVVHAHRDIGGLLVYRHVDGAGSVVESQFGFVVSYPFDGFAHYPRYVGISVVQSYFAHNEYLPRRGCRFARHPAVGIELKHGVQYRVGYLVANFIGMTFGHRFRSKKSFHCASREYGAITAPHPFLLLYYSASASAVSVPIRSESS